jgi:hypothetical protein
MAANGDERRETNLDRIEAKLDRVGERLEASIERSGVVEDNVLRIGERVALVDRKLDLTQAQLRARIDALRLELLDDMQAMLKLELGGRRTLAEAEIDRLRAEVEEMGRRLEAVERR